MTEDYDLGEHSWPIATTSADAQRWFDRGLAWCYGFNHEEAIQCFETALEYDADCAMAQWGVAYAVGPNYNKPWAAFDDRDKQRALARAQAALTAAETAAAGSASALEQALIAAFALRYPADARDEALAAGGDAFADAMRRLHADHPSHPDICALFAEALMNRTPWAMWDMLTGAPAEGADTVEAQTALETAFATLDGAMRHPGMLHMYIHLMEMSPHPERALPMGDALIDLAPDAGHLVHMPTHIDVLCGHYQTVIERNTKAIAADRKYLETKGALNFYSAYRCHNYHFKVYGAMFAGRRHDALSAAEEMIETVPTALLKTGSPPMADWLEGFVPIKQHVLVRFGAWREILAQPLPEDAELYAVTTATMRYARAIAFAVTGAVAAAEREREAFLIAKARTPDTRMLFNNRCIDILEIADAMMAGELDYRKGAFDTAFGHLRRAVELDDTLPYDEPWGWMQPTRHALGALLMEQDRIEEAEAVYRADLGLDDSLRRACQHPDNVWSLHGLHECLTRRGDRVEAPLIKQRLDLALARADTPIAASCFCRIAAPPSAAPAAERGRPERDLTA